MSPLRPLLAPMILAAALAGCATAPEPAATAPHAAAAEAAHGAAHGAPAPDTRTRVVLAAPARDLVLLEMRHMLGSVHDVLRALGTGDRAAAERAARASGLGAAADVEPEVRAALPPAFLALGMQTHKAFDALADRIAAGGTPEETTAALASITASCVSCHQAYRLDEAR